MWTPPATVRLAALLWIAGAALAAGSGLGGWAGWQVNGMRWEARHEAFRARTAEGVARGWQAALRLYQTEQGRAERAERAADTAVRRLREQGKKHEEELLAAMKSGACKTWAESPISCPVSWR